MKSDCPTLRAVLISLSQSLAKRNSPPHLLERSVVRATWDERQNSVHQLACLESKSQRKNWAIGKCCSHPGTGIDEGRMKITETIGSLSEPVELVNTRQKDTIRSVFYNTMVGRIREA